MMKQRIDSELRNCTRELAFLRGRRDGNVEKSIYINMTINEEAVVVQAKTWFNDNNQWIVQLGGQLYTCVDSKNSNLIKTILTGRDLKYFLFMFSKSSSHVQLVSIRSEQNGEEQMPEDFILYANQ